MSHLGTVFLEDHMKRLPILLTIAVLLTAFHYGSTYDGNRYDKGGMKPKRFPVNEIAARNRAIRGDSPMFPKDPSIINAIPVSTEAPKPPVDVPELIIEIPSSAEQSGKSDWLYWMMLSRLPV
jgi:hypothetical protein